MAFSGLFVFIILTAANLSAQQCDGILSNSLFFEDFSSGPGAGPSLPPGTTTYTFGSIGGGNYVVTNTTGLNGSLWHNSPDHTPNDANGYCLLFDASFSPGIFYNRLFEDLCPNTNYTFSCYVANIVRPFACDGNSIEPNLKFTLLDPSTMNELGSVVTGNIATTETMTWNQFSIVFNTNQTQQNVLIEITNNANGGCGNDLAIDDFSFNLCNPTQEQAFDLCSLPNASIQVGNQTYTDPGVYETIVDVPNSCNDSIVYTTLTGGESSNITQNFIICDQQSITIDGVIYTSDTIVIDTLVANENCFETVTYIIEDESSITTEQIYFCEGDSVFLLDTWYTESGLYQDTLTSILGCDSIVAYNIESFRHRVQLNATMITLSPGETIQLFATSNAIGDVEYQWLPAPLFSCESCTDPIFSPNTSGTYTLVGHDLTTGCMDSLEFSVIVEPCKESYFPNVFSPNHDGTNDIYRPYLSDCVIEVLAFQIFDRWGNIIHIQHNIPVDAPRWDGSFRSQEASVGVYVYYLNARLYDGSTKLYKGDITLLR